MDLTISSRASLSAVLLDPVTGLGGSEPVGFNFGGGAEITGAGIVSLSLVLSTGDNAHVSLGTGSMELVSEGESWGTEVIQSYAAESAWVQNADWFEVVLAADPLAVDVFGNPIPASRASQVTIQALDADDGVQAEFTLNVTTAGQAAIFRRASKTSGAKAIVYLAVSGVTANAAKLYINFGGNSGT